MDISYLGHFIAGQIIRSTDKTPADKMSVDKTDKIGQNTSQNRRGGQNTGHSVGQEGQNANLIKTLIISYR